MQTIEDNSVQNIKHYVDILEKLEKSCHSSMKPDEYSRLIDKVFQRLNQEIDRAKGNKIVVDLANLPVGMKLDEWNYYSDTLGVVFIDTRPKPNVFKASPQKQYVIPEEYKVVTGLGTNYVIPQTKDIPAKYWGLLSQNKVVAWYEE